MSAPLLSNFQPFLNHKERIYFKSRPLNHKMGHYLISGSVFSRNKMQENVRCTNNGKKYPRTCIVISYTLRIRQMVNKINRKKDVNAHAFLQILSLIFKCRIDALCFCKDTIHNSTHNIDNDYFIRDQCFMFFLLFEVFRSCGRTCYEVR